MIMKDGKQLLNKCAITNPYKRCCYRQSHYLGNYILNPMMLL